MNIFWHYFLMVAWTFTGGWFIGTAARFWKSLKVVPTSRDYFGFGVHVMLSIWTITNLISALINSPFGG